MIIAAAMLAYRMCMKKKLAAIIQAAQSKTRISITLFIIYHLPTVRIPNEM